ncbi:MAG: hypothetical protein DRG76_09030, partial [Deltaproteobacteria bacterium]
AREKYIKILELTLSEEAVTEELLDDLRELAFTFPGECRLRFRVHTKKGKTLLVDAHSRFRVIPTAELVSRLERLTGSPVRARMG